jgi:hypothetical protein
MGDADMAASKKQKLWHSERKDAKRDYDRAYRATNKERIVAAKAAHVLANPEADAARKARYRETHRAKLRIDNIAYNRANAVDRAAYLKQYQLDNRSKVRYWAMKRHTAKLQRVPAWLTADDHWMIEQAYELAVLRTSMFGVPWHVDHVLPLQGKTVSGLHVPTNLQVILGVENARKGNRV